jgi:type I restriction enzyme S subunit
MRSNYKRLKPFIRQVDRRNIDGKTENLLGVSTQKVFIESIANTVGTDFTLYKVVKRKQFVYVPDTSRRGDKIGIAMLETHDEGLVSQAYTVFEIIDHEQLDPEYLMMWFRRPEFDRYARFKSHGSVREIFDWEEMSDVELPIPSIDRQREIVREYNIIVERIKLNERINVELEDLVKDQFNNVFSDSLSLEESELVDSANTLDELIEFNPAESVRKGALTSYIEMADIQEAHMTVTGKIIREFTSGSKFRNEDTLLARITPCMENGKTAFINCLNNNEVAYGSTEFIVMRSTKKCNPYWVYCLARHDFFRSYAISSMGGSDGRQRVQSDYLKVFPIGDIQVQQVGYFGQIAEPIFRFIQLKAEENQSLKMLKDTVLSKMAT